MQQEIYYEHDGVQFLTYEFMQTLITYDLVIEAPRGGLVMGPAHSEGGIMLFRRSLEFEKEFEVVAEIEGWEFLMNPFGTEQYQEEITKINSEFDGTLPFSPYQIPDDILLIDANPIEISGIMARKWLLLGPASQWIVNRHSTQKYIKWLHETNELTWRKNV